MCTFLGKKFMVIKKEIIFYYFNYNIKIKNKFWLKIVFVFDVTLVLYKLTVMK